MRLLCEFKSRAVIFTKEQRVVVFKVCKISSKKSLIVPVFYGTDDTGTDVAELFGRF